MMLALALYVFVGLLILATVMTNPEARADFAAWPARRRAHYMAIVVFGWPLVVFGKDVA